MVWFDRQDTENCIDLLAENNIQTEKIPTIQHVEQSSDENLAIFQSVRLYCGPVKNCLPENISNDNAEAGNLIEVCEERMDGVVSDTQNVNENETFDDFA